MLDVSQWLDLPLVWGLLLATALFVYVALDGFDLGCGVLFPFAPSEKCRDRIMSSVIPFWDGNETWLILAGGVLFVAFPLAFSILMPALYLPVIFMLIGLIFRGVAFEFRSKATPRGQTLWNHSFHFGSLLAAFMQGVMLGNLIQGVQVSGRVFSGTAFDWANGFAILTGLALVLGYALLGATWLILRMENETQDWARACAKNLVLLFALSSFAIVLSVPFVGLRVTKAWFVEPLIFVLFPIFILSALVMFALRKSVQNTAREKEPFLLTISLFLLMFVAFCVSLYPWVVPFEFTLWQAAASSASHTLMLAGAVVFLPIVLIYTGYCYYVFWGKVTDEISYD